MFLWMFIEGLHLHNLIAVSVFEEKISEWVLCCVGWLSPGVLTTIWAVVTFDQFRGIKCFWGYNLSASFWILEGPRLFVITLNLIFLLNIIRVLVTKLRESRSSEAQQVRKAVRAAIILLPLLGITNSIQMIHSPVDKHAIQFALWAYFTAILTSFQGFFCCLIYCFLNGEVQSAVRRRLRARCFHRSRLTVSGRLNSRPSIKIQEVKTERVKFTRKASRVEQATTTREYWNDDQSHNHVDIEHIEIPEDLYILHGGKINASRCESVNISILNSASVSPNSSPPGSVGQKGQMGTDTQQQFK